MRYYRLTYRNRTLPTSTLGQDQRTYASESLRRHLLKMYRGMADNPTHVRVDVVRGRDDIPTGAIVWHKLTSERTGLWTIWDRVRIERV